MKKSIKDIIIRGLAQWTPARDIIRNAGCEQGDIDRVKRSSQAEILQIREAYLNDLSDVPYAHSEMRVRKLSDLIVSGDEKTKLAALKLLHDMLGTTARVPENLPPEVEAEIATLCDEK